MSRSSDLEGIRVPVSVERRGAAAIVTLDHPPVNAIGHAERQGLLDAALQLAADKTIDRIIVTGRGSIFAAGADAREFDSVPLEPHLPEVIATIEDSPVPWIAAINGAALGGGAEILLGCRYRVAAPSANIGFPEVTLGVVPGAGGTQRLPRLVGMKAALELISQGRPVSAKEASEIGLVDAISDDPVRAAETLDLAIIAARQRLSHLKGPMPDAGAVAQATDSAARKLRLQAAPVEAIALVALSATAPFPEAMRAERAAFLKLRQSDQSKSLRHIFFAERQAKAPATIAAAAPVDVRRAVVVGGGNMGASIAYALDSAGIGVTIVETDEAGADRAGANLAKLVDGAAARGLLSAEEAASRKSRMVVATGYAALGPAELAIEAAFEDMTVKKAVFASLEKALPGTAVLATNTSYLDVNEIAASVSDPTRVVGMHFFSPAHIMKLLEIVRGEKTSAEALATAFAMAKRLRKIPVLAGVCDGFIGNRILARYREAADTILMDGSTPWEIDEAMVEFGYPMGPYEVNDLSGLDIGYATRKRQAATRDPNRRYIPIADRMVEEGRLGRKTGVGWYRYPGGGGKVVDPLIEDLVREEARFAKAKRREFTADEIRERLVVAMINEAAAILDERMAQSAADIDLVTVHGYGFPRWRGGLLFHADTVGVDAILERLRVFAKDDPVAWKPSPLIERLAAEKRRFADFRRG